VFASPESVMPLPGHRERGLWE